MIDFELLDQLETEDCDELADVDLAHELLLGELPYIVEESEHALIANTALTPVPKLVSDQLQAYMDFIRLAPDDQLRMRLYFQKSKPVYKSIYL